MSEVSEDEVVSQLGDHINMLGGSVKALLNYVKGQDIAIQVIGNFLKLKHGTEFLEFFKEESARIESDGVNPNVG